MNKKVFVIGILVIVLGIFIIPHAKSNKNSIIKENYNVGNLQIGVNYLKSKANDSSITNYEDGNKGEMYKVETPEINGNHYYDEYYYIGDRPNNYVYFNCTDDNDVSTCEVWRILMIQYNNKYNGKIKIVRDSVLPVEMEWDSIAYNHWNLASLKSYLNGEYYNSLSDSAKKLIYSMNYNFNYYIKYDDVNHYGSINDIYKVIDESGAEDNRIGLMFPADYGFTYALGIDNVCINDLSLCNENNNAHPNRSWLYNTNIKQQGGNKIDTWLLTAVYSTQYVNYISSDGSLSKDYPGNGTDTLLKGVRPTLYLDVYTMITDGDGSINNPYKLSSFKDYSSNLNPKINYNGVDYYVLNDDGENVTLLKAEPLSYEEIKKYNLKHKTKKIGNIGLMQYYYSDTCYYQESAGHSQNVGGCNTNYNNSFIKEVVDGWTNDNVCSDAIAADSRLLTHDDLIDNLGYIPHQLVTDSWLKLTEYVPSWLYNSNYNQWTMSESDDRDKTVFVIQKDGNVSDGYRGTHEETYLSSFNAVRPVITIKKSMINNQCSKKSNCKTISKLVGYQGYDIGDEIEYRDDDYFVINKSDNSSDYVVALKKNPLTVAEINLLKNQYEINDSSNTGYGKYPYYKDDLCNNYNNDSGCKTNYDASDIKKLVDDWSEQFGEELISIDGYKSRLLNENDLFDNIGVTTSSTPSEVRILIPEWLHLQAQDDYALSFWTMLNSDDSSVYAYNYINELYGIKTFNYGYIRPVINLNKCAIDGGCIYEKTYECTEEPVTDIKNDDINGNKTVVNVENTLKFISKILLIISIILIISGSTFIGYNYIKSKKERK